MMLKLSLDSHISKSPQIFPSVRSSPPFRWPQISLYIIQQLLRRSRLKQRP
ncbi:hypothetical protein LINPERHAP1_LOCUS41520 [Linum perenne]